MTILLTLLYLLATECRVHRNPCTNTVDFGVTCNLNHPWMGDSCVVDSHWFPCTVVEKCDTVCLSSGVAGSTYRITCHPETTLVDSGGYDEGWWFSVPDGSVDVRKDETDTLWIFDTPFLRSEMPDLKEMLREWRVAKCIDRALPNRHWIAYVPEYEQAKIDSCECVYGGRK